jgi:hypothetical protein
MVCGIDQAGIQNVTLLESLDVSYNSKITDVNHLKKLNDLRVRGTCGVNQKGIQELTSLKSFCSEWNKKIMKQ